MIAIKVNSDDIKIFMAKLLIHEMFDDFLLEKAQVLTSSELVLSGRRNKNWYDSEQWKDLEQKFSNDCYFMRWEEIKHTIFDYIKGNQSPELMKISFKAGRNQVEQWLKDSGALETYQRQEADLFLQVWYEQGILQIVTGISFPQFQMDRTVERAWDDAALQFLRREKITYE